MKFRPCIDIHNGKVKQIVGGSLSDEGAQVEENFTAEQGGDDFATLYREHGLRGGHIILLNPKGTPEYDADLIQAKAALEAFPGGMQIGGGMNAKNAKQFLDMGASHVIVTSAIFDGAELRRDILQELSEICGREHLVVDLSCRRKGDQYYVVTNRWQTFTDLAVNKNLLDELAQYCDEFLIHGVDVEGLGNGFEEDLIRILASHQKNPITYAGGISSLEDIRRLSELSDGRLDFTIGSALDIFGGPLSFEDVVAAQE